MIKRLLMGIYLTAICFAVVTGELPQDVRKTLDEHTGELQKLLAKWHSRPDQHCGSNVVNPDWLPGYFIKYDIARVVNAVKLKNLIQSNNLNLLSVPKKYVYQVLQKTSAPTNANSIVIAKKVNGELGWSSRKHLSTRQK